MAKVYTPEQLKGFWRMHRPSDFDPSRIWPAEQWFIDQLMFADGKINAVFGLPKAGKSRFLLWCLASVFSGRTALGLPVKAVPERVIWLLGEEEEKYPQWRLTRYAQLLGADPTGWPITFVRAAAMGLDQLSNRQIFVDQYLLQYKPDLLVIDPLRRVHNLQESSNDQMPILLNDFRRWVQTLKSSNGRSLSMAIVHHTGKPREGEILDNIVSWSRGATDFPAIVDAAMFLQDSGWSDVANGRRVDVLRAGRLPVSSPISLIDQGAADKSNPAMTDLGWRRE